MSNRKLKAEVRHSLHVWVLGPLSTGNPQCVHPQGVIPDVVDRMARFHGTTVTAAEVQRVITELTAG